MNENNNPQLVLGKTVDDVKRYRQDNDLSLSEVWALSEPNQLLYVDRSESVLILPGAEYRSDFHLFIGEMNKRGIAQTYLTQTYLTQNENLTMKSLRFIYNSEEGEDGSMTIQFSNDRSYTISFINPLTPNRVIRTLRELANMIERA